MAECVEFPGPVTVGDTGSGARNFPLRAEREHPCDSVILRVLWTAE
jgi:hypothetical protein